VVAAGYDPIVITSTNTNIEVVYETIKDTQLQFQQEDSAKEEGTFTPEIEILEAPAIAVEEEKVTIKLIEEGSNLSMILIVSFVIAMILMIACAVKLVINVSKKQAIDAEAIARAK